MDDPRQPASPEENRILRAAEVALGLEAEDRNALLRSDPDLAREVERWEDDLARFSDELRPIPPHPRTWTALHSAIERDVSPGTTGDGAVAETSWWRGWVENLALWRGLTAAGLATAAALALLLLRSPGAVPTAPGSPTQAPTVGVLLVSPLLPRDGPPAYVATYDSARTRLLIVPAATQAVPDREPRLWLVPNDTGEPIALGALDPERPHALVLSQEQARHVDLRAGLVITLEPAGGADGAARGPVIAHGRFTGL